jgi:hypothetical protein
MLFPIKKKKEMKEKFKCQVKEARVPANSCSARQVINTNHLLLSIMIRKLGQVMLQEK